MCIAVGNKSLQLPVSIVFISLSVVAETWRENKPLRWRHNEQDDVWNHQPHDCLLSRLFRRRSKNTSKLRVTGLCGGNSPVIGEFPAQRASHGENVSIWWRHYAYWKIPSVMISHVCSSLIWLIIRSRASLIGQTLVLRSLGEASV